MKFYKIKLAMVQDWGLGIEPGVSLCCIVNFIHVSHTLVHITPLAT